VSYRVTGTGCSDATPSNNGRSIILSVTSVAYCSVVASQPTDGKYASVVSTSRTLSFGLLTADTLTVTNNASRYLVNAPVTLTTSGGNGGAITYSIVGTVGSCVLDGNTVSSNKAALCLVTATQSASGSYGAVVSSPKGFYFNTISAAPLSLPDTVTAKAGKAITLLASGGIDGLETATFNITGINCGASSKIVSGKSVTFTPMAATACTVTVSQGPTDSYNLVSFTKNYSFTSDASPALLIAPETESAFAGIALRITVSGGNPDTSTVTYRVTGDTACGSGTLSLDKRTLTLNPSIAAFCTVSASQPAAGRYGYVTSTSRTIAFRLAQSPALIIDETVTATAGQEFRFKARGGNGSAISYTVTGTGCSDNSTDGDGYLTIRTTAVVYCNVQARQAATPSLIPLC